MVQRFDHFRRRPFLRAENTGSALPAHQRVADVAGHVETAFLQPSVQPADIDFGQLRQSRATASQLPAVGIFQPDAQRLQHSRAAIVGGAAAQPDDEMAHAFVQRRQNQFAYAVSRGNQGIALFRRHLFQTAGGSDFDEGDFPVA